MTMILTSLLVGIWIRDLIGRGIYRPDDKKDKDKEGIVSKMAWELAQTVPLAGNFVYGIHGLINYGSTSNMLSGVPAIDTFIKGSQAVGTGYIAKKPETKWKNYLKAAAYTGTLLGVPGSQQAAQFIQGHFSKANNNNKWQKIK